MSDNTRDVVLDPLFKAVERVMQPHIPNFTEQNKLCSCPNPDCPDYDSTVVVAAGEIWPGYCLCGAELEPIACEQCDESATHMRNMGMERQGVPSCVETWITREEARCEKHRR